MINFLSGAICKFLSVSLRKKILDAFPFDFIFVVTRCFIYANPDSYFYCFVVFNLTVTNLSAFNDYTFFPDIFLLGAVFNSVLLRSEVLVCAGKHHKVRVWVIRFFG